MANFGKELAENKSHEITISRLADENVNQVKFPGFVTEFSDTFNSNWNPESVYGRMDPILNFQNTQRKINISFRVVGENEISMIKNQNRLSTLIKMLYPGYYDNAVSSAPLLRVDYVNYIPNLVCALDTFDYTPNFDESQSWIDYENSIVPTYFDINLQLNIIHEQIMGFNDNEAGLRIFGNFDGRQNPPPIGYGSRGSPELDDLQNQLFNERYPTTVAEEVSIDGSQTLSRRGRRQQRRSDRRKRRQSRRLGNTPHELTLSSAELKAAKVYLAGTES
jgi:hypothetical protein